MKSLPRIAVLVLALVAVCGCSRGDGGGELDAEAARMRFPEAPVVLVSIDTLRSDRLPAYGYRGVETPALDEMRRDSVLVERAYSHYPLTLPSHVSLLTGELPTTHKVRDNLGYPFEAGSHVYLPALLKGKGYATGAAVSAFVLRGATGLGSGFDFYEDRIVPFPGETVDAAQRAGSETVRRAVEWVRGRAGAPFFLFVHLYEPHAPYDPPEPFASRYADAYDGEVAAADAAVGELVAELKRLEVYDRAVILVLSDHGEGLGDHGERQHGIFLYRETLQVPLMVKLPGSRYGGRSISRPVGLMDVVPTIASLVGLELPEDGRLAGRSAFELAASPVVEGKDGAERQIYSETFYPRLHLGWSDLASLIEGRMHYVEAPTPELYDLVEDPGETRSLVASERRAYAGLRKALGAHDRTLAAPVPVDQETASRLASLGYLGGTTVAGGALPDPKTQKAALGDLERVFELRSEGRPADAVPLLRRLVEANPKMVDVWGFLATALYDLGRKEEALAAYQKALALSGGAPHLAAGAAGLLFDLGRFDEAARHAELAVAADPEKAYETLFRIAVAQRDEPGAVAVIRRVLADQKAGESLRRRFAVRLAEIGRPEEALPVLRPLAASGDPAAVNDLAEVLSYARRLDEAKQALLQLAAAHPDNARAHEQLGQVTLKLQQPQEARVHLERALAISSRRPVSWNALGVALYQLEGPQAALAAWQRAVELDPQQWEALLNIGMVAGQTGRPEEARQALRQFIATAPPQRYSPDIEQARGLLRRLGG